MSKRYIDAEQFEKLYAKQLTLGNDPANAVYDAIDDCSSVDAVEVVRCKDCTMYTGKYCTLTDDGEDVREPDDFCSYGERRIDDGK